MDYKFETRCIHRENEHEEGHPYGSVCTPIYQTATFYHPGIGQTTGFNYTRESNPTRTELEDIVTSLEEAKDTVACANGMAAIVLCMELFESGDHIVCSEDLYGGSVRMFQTTGEKRGLTFTYVNTADAAATEAAIKSNTKALYHRDTKQSDYADHRPCKDEESCRQVQSSFNRRQYLLITLFSEMPIVLARSLLFTAEQSF